MNLHNYFASQCRATSALLKTQSPTVKAMVSGRKNKERIGTVATFSFDGFKMDISFIERGRAAYAQQTIWLSFVLESDEALPFSVYDILAVAEPENFKCYTYTYVDSISLMRDCFGEINELLGRIIPHLFAIVGNGVEKNRLISTQRETVNKYFGDSVIEQSERLGGAADNLMNMMMRNFYEAQIESAVVGSQSYFYNGKADKALKKLSKSKCRSRYQENLLNFIKNGGSPEKKSETLSKASSEKGARRHGDTFAETLRILGLGMLIDVPVSLILTGLFYLATKIMFHNAILYMGFYENVFFMPFFGSLVSVCIAIHLLRERREKTRGNDDNAVFTLKTPALAGTILKYLTIVAETLALIGCVSGIYSTTVFYNNSIAYSQADIPLSHQEISYDTVDKIALVAGYGTGENFTRRPYIAIVTKSGAVIDLYNSTNLSAEDFSEKADFLKDKGVEIINVRTIDELD